MDASDGNDESKQGLTIVHSTTDETQGASQFGDLVVARDVPGSGQQCGEKLSWVLRYAIAVNVVRVFEDEAVVVLEEGDLRHGQSYFVFSLILAKSASRLKASQVRSAARKEIESNPWFWCAAGVARRW